MNRLQPVTNPEDVWLIFRSLVGEFHTILYKSLPIGLDRKTLQGMDSQHVYTTFKVDGTWCLLFKCVQHQKVYVILRDQTIYHMENHQFTYPDADGTFVVMAEATRSHFLVFDVVYRCDKGSDVCTVHTPFIMRYQGLQDCCFTDPCIIVKPIYTEQYDQNESGVWMYNGHSFPVDGLILYYKEKCYKWKDPQHHTIDVAIKPCRNNGTVSTLYTPYVSRKIIPLRGVQILDQTGLVPRVDYSESTRGDNNPMCIVECSYKAGTRWEVVRIRTDKHVPNNLHTVLHTIRCQSEHLTQQELWCTLYGSQEQRLDFLVSQWLADPFMELEVRYRQCTYDMYTRARHHMHNPEFTQTEDTFYLRNVRCTTTIVNGKPDVSRRQTIQKQPRGSLDIVTCFGILRVALQREVPVSFPDGHVTYHRRKRRHREAVHNGHFWFDATEVADSRGHRTYEVELECQRELAPSSSIGRKLLQTFQLLVHSSKKKIQLK